jgi:predicted dehydrogenase
MLRGAIVGFGNVAQFGHWPGYASRADIEIAAIVDSSAARRDAAQALDRSLPVFATLSELEREIALDFIDICTPPAKHLEPMLEAISRGWHVLCEKPLLLNQGDVEEVTKRASAADLAVLPVHNWKYAPIIRRATELLRAGTIGNLRELEITTLRVGDAATADSSQPGWRRDPATAGGGILMDHGWHAVYLALDWFRETPADSVAELHRTSRDAVEDAASVKLSFPSGSATIQLSWKAQTRANRFRFRGDHGEILIDDDTLQVGGETVRYELGLTAGSHHADWFAAMLPDVVTAFADPTLARARFDQAAKCLDIIQRTYATANWRVG